VVCAPAIFFIYLKHDLVCAPRAIVSSAIFGVFPLVFLTIAFLKKKKAFYYFTLLVLIIEIIITPIIMLDRLGREKFFNERLLAFFTFEGIAIVQSIMVVMLLAEFLRSQKDKIPA
ncbi:hypothetical protein JXJ21_14920, partial [candidate division KSB1 bacterium]|nr:hypothetical protein [candidate division KSB1 bacterium]